MRSLLTILALGCTTTLASVAPALAQNSAPVRAIAGPEAMHWQTEGDFEGGLLTVSGPNGPLRLEFEGRQIPALDVVTGAGKALADGSYTWELRLYPARAVHDRAVARRAGEPAKEASSAFGYFTVKDGSFVSQEEEETASATDRRRIESREQDEPERLLVNENLIVIGSTCIGVDCVNGENFGFDTIRLKENNLRLKFEDTSVGSFPSTDWQLTANDTANGGANRFSIDDVTGGRTPFTIEAGAPSHSLYVDDSGRLGLGTSTPVVEAHMVDGDSPTLRLEQDGSSGFAPQTWDVVGNETAFFVRDVTNGSQLPFRIRSSAPGNSLYIAEDGDIGLGTSSPTTNARLHVVANTGIGQIDSILLENNEAARLTLRNNTIVESTTDKQNWTLNSNGTFRLVPGDGGWALRLDAEGNLRVKGNFISGSTTLNVPDYVFEPDYELMPLTELEAFVTEKRHLPEVPTADAIKQSGLDVTDMQLRLLRKVEELTLYTLEQQKTIDDLRARLEAVEGQ